MGSFFIVVCKYHLKNNKLCYQFVFDLP